VKVGAIYLAVFFFESIIHHDVHVITLTVNAYLSSPSNIIKQGGDAYLSNMHDVLISFVWNWLMTDDNSPKIQPRY
jgi:hypothetical protein